MLRIFACAALFVMSACATDRSAERPAATPSTEPAPLSGTQGAEPGTKTVITPPENPLPAREAEPAETPKVTPDTPGVK